jgi:NAD(P)-dependent dehydrogenase (short-subunit alcohol dehydrogenase family)
MTAAAAIAHEMRGTMRLKNKVVLVAGADTEQGRAVAVALAREGADIAAWVRDAEGGSITAREIADLGRRCQISTLPLAGRRDAEAIVAQSVKTFGALDALVNLGNPRRVVGTILEATDEDFEEEITADLRVTLWLSRPAIPEMARRGGGAIIIFGSILFQGVKGRAMRSMSKAAITGLTRAMAGDHGPQKIRVNAVLPGPVSTSDRSAEQIQGYANESALKELTSPGDAANAVVFLLSDEGRNITGQLLAVDGGRSIGWF